MRRWLVGLLVWPLLAGPAWAHSLEVFAYAEGSVIVGSVYLTSGAPASNATVAIRGPDDAVLGEPELNAEGEFRYTAQAAVAHRVVATTDDGHRAEWRVPAGELEGAASPGSSAGKAAPEASDQPHPKAADGTITIEREALEALVERAVAREVGPLRAELRGYANRVRLSDIIGGIGGIIGIAGAALWWRARRREAA